MYMQSALNSCLTRFGAIVCVCIYLYYYLYIKIPFHGSQIWVNGKDWEINVYLYTLSEGF